MKLTKAEFRFLKKQQRINRHNKGGDWSWQYKQAIAVLAEKLNASGLPQDIDLKLLLSVGIHWNDLAKELPEFQKVVLIQASNFSVSRKIKRFKIDWVYKYQPSDWKHWLD
jgi:hypothetical protein